MAMRIPSGENPFATDVAIGNPGKYSLVDPSLEGSPESKLSKEASDKLAKWQGELDRTQTLDAINQIEQHASDLELEYSQIKGENATNPADGKSLSETYGNKFKLASDDILNKIKRPEVRAKVSEFVQARNNKFYEGMNKYIIKEQSAYAAAVEADTGSRLYKKAVDPNPEISNDGIVGLRSLEASQTARTGLPSDHKLLGSAHLMQIGNFCIKKDYKGAKEYLTQFRSEMTPQQIGRAEKTIDATKIDALSDHEFKKATKGFNYLADETQYAQDTVEAAKKLSGIPNEKVREQAEAKFAAYLRTETKKRKLEAEQLRLTLLEIVDSFKKDGNEAQATVPQDMLEELRALDRNGANSVDVYLSKMRKQGEIQSDPETKSFIESIEQKDRDEFMKIDFSQYAHVLSKKDISYFTRLQNRYANPDNAYNAFERELRQYVEYNKVPAKDRARVKQAARDMYELEAQKTKLGYLDSDERKQVIEYIFADKDVNFFSWMFSKPNWKDISDPKSGVYSNVRNQIVKGVNLSAGEKIDELVKNFGGKPEELSSEQRSILTTYFSKGVLPPRLWNECRKKIIANRALKKIPKPVTDVDIRSKCIHEIILGYGANKGEENGSK